MTTKQHNFHASKKATDSGFIVLVFDDEPFKDVHWTYGETKLEEDLDGCKLVFNYTILEGTVPDVLHTQFKEAIGDILLNILEDQLKKSEVIYHGGVDKDIEG